MSYHYVGKLVDTNVFLPYVVRVPALFVEPHQPAYPKARVWAAFAFSPGVVGILVGVYIGIATADVGNLLNAWRCLLFWTTVVWCACCAHWRGGGIFSLA